jgi:flagellar biosynthesis/type III secretory pathway chaperone
MTTPASRADQSPLEAVLREVHATLVELLLAADEQYSAVAARDRDRIESVTRQQERLSARLARAEARRMELLNGSSLAEAISQLSEMDAARVGMLRDAIATAVRELKMRQNRTAQLLARSIELGKQTLDFLHRLVTSPSPAYDVRGVSTVHQSVLLDSRA